MGLFSSYIEFLFVYDTVLSNSFGLFGCFFNNYNLATEYLIGSISIFFSANIPILLSLAFLAIFKTYRIKVNYLKGDI